jgi:hypothetical protein
MSEKVRFNLLSAILYIISALLLAGAIIMVATGMHFLNVKTVVFLFFVGIIFALIGYCLDSIRNKLKFCPLCAVFTLLSIVPIILTIVIVMNDMQQFYSHARYVAFSSLVLAYIAIYFQKRFEKKHNIKTFTILDLFKKKDS